MLTGATQMRRSASTSVSPGDADGTSICSGDPSLCTGCHGSGADMVRAFGFPP
jgi:hypothetical protein